MRLTADRISPLDSSRYPHQVRAGSKDCICLTGPLGTGVIEGTSARLGAFAGKWKDWHLTGSSVPDGTFAIVRSDEFKVEICTDYAGSRTIWYACSENCFLASTSQRALICLLKGFELNKSAFAWFLSSGNLGPSDSWDTRVSRLPRNARLVLDRASWRMDVHETPVVFHPTTRRADECRNEFLEILQETVKSFDFTSARWLLPLSGGYDCRFLLATLYKNGLRPPTVTWGLAASLSQPGNDAYVARHLAEYFHLQHDYVLTDRSGEQPELVVDRFLSACGGSTDQLFPYLDGLHLWESFAAQGFEGIIRGDEGFGWIPIKSEQYARTSICLLLLEDFMDKQSAEQISDGKQVIPDELKRDSSESLATYRDRLYHAYRIPIGLAALNDVKSPFVEIASPLLTREVLAYIRQMPDQLRTGKALFQEIAKFMGPPLPYATMAADDDRNDFLWSEPYSHWLKEELQNDIAFELLPTAFREELLLDFDKASSGMKLPRSTRALLKRIIPTSWVHLVKAQMGTSKPEKRELILRCALAFRMIKLLKEDARVLNLAKVRHEVNNKSL